MYYHMSDIFICKHCDKEMGIKQFARHLWKVHQQKYEDYVFQHLEEFKHLNWKLCSNCNSLFRGTSLKCGSCYTKNHNIKKDQYIQCCYCNESIHSKVVSIHLKSHHNVEFSDYVKEHLDDFRKMGWCNCVICGNICKNISKKHNEPTCSPECVSKIRKTWIGKNSDRFGIPMTNDGKKNISLSKIGIPNDKIKGDLNPSKRKEVREQISKTRIERGVAKGAKNPMFGKTHTPETIKKIMSHRPMNKLERLVADELDKLFIPYYFQYFITENGVCKSYDFKIKGKPIILEVDGDFWHGNPNTNNHHIHVKTTIINDKLKEDMAFKRGMKVIRLWESDINNDPSIIERVIDCLV